MSRFVKKKKTRRFLQKKFKKALLALKLTSALMILSAIQLSANGVYSQSTKFNLEIKNQSLIEVFDQIRNQSEYTFAYNTDDVKLINKLNFSKKDASLEEILSSCLKGTNLSYEVLGKIVVISQGSQQQKREIRGKIVDEKGNALPGVTIAVKEGDKLLSGTVSDASGIFRLEIDGRANTLVVSMMGFETQSIKIGKQATYSLTMKPDVKEVEEVVVTGIFTKARESFTGAATFISKEELQEFKSQTLLHTIANVDPSFAILDDNEYGSDPNRLPEINIRGASTVPIIDRDLYPNVSEVEWQEIQDKERSNLNTPLFILDGFEISLERMMDLDPTEVESVTILKDASSTALYGSRGANGIVVLTSVKPEAGKLRISVSGGTNLEIPDLSSYNLLNAREKLELERLAGLHNADKDDKNYKPETQLAYDLEYYKKLRSIAEGSETYWLSQPLQVGIASNARLSMSGGDRAFRYSLSGSINNTKGIMKGSLRNNFNGNSSLSYLLGKFRFTNNISVGVNASEDSQYGSFSTYAELNPYWRIHDDSGRMLEILGRDYLQTVTPVKNPVYIANLGGFDRSGYNTIRNNFSVEWNPIETLRLTIRSGIALTNRESHNYKPSTHPDYEEEEDDNKKGEYTLSDAKSSSWDFSVTANYGKVIKEDHRFTLGFNFDIRENKSASYGFTMQGFTHEKLNYISMGSQFKTSPGVSNPTGSERTIRSVGLVNNLNYVYKNAIFVDASYRLDGASTFGKASRFKPFYSVGAGFNVHQLNWVKEHLPFVSQLRVKYNYGVSGTLQFSQPYQAMTVYQYGIATRFDGDIGATLMGIANEDLSWQMDYSHNFGADMAFFKNKLRFNFNIYRKITEGMTTTANLPLTNGFPVYTVNKGDVLNKGYDFSLSVTLLKRKDLRWTIRTSMARNTNILLSLSDKMKSISAELEKDGKTMLDPNYIYREGEPMDALYVVSSIGVDPATGKEIFLDAYGNPTYNWSRAVRRKYGVMNPKIRGGFSSSFSYKGLSLTASFSYKYGAQALNSTLQTKVERADVTKNVDKRVLELRWKQPGDRVAFIGLDPDEHVAKPSSRFVQDNNSFSLNSLNLRYRLPIKWVKKNLSMTSVDFSASISDIFYFSTIKRERGTTYPFSIKPRFSLSMTF